MQSHQKDTAHPTNDQEAQALSATDQHSSAKIIEMGLFKEKMEDMQKMLSGPVETHLKDTQKHAQDTMDASKVWAEASKEMHEKAFKQWKDASKTALDEMNGEHRDVQASVKEQVVFVDNNHAQSKYTEGDALKGRKNKYDGLTHLP